MQVKRDAPRCPSETIRFFPWNNVPYGRINGVLMTSTTSRYSSRFSMVFQPSERAMLQALAEAAGLDESAWVRQVVRREYARMGRQVAAPPVGEPKKKPAGRPKRARGAT